MTWMTSKSLGKHIKTDKSHSVLGCNFRFLANTVSFSFSSFSSSSSFTFFFYSLKLLSTFGTRTIKLNCLIVLDILTNSVSLICRIMCFSGLFFPLFLSCSLNADCCIFKLPLPPSPAVNLASCQSVCLWIGLYFLISSDPSLLLGLLCSLQFSALQWAAGFG